MSTPTPVIAAHLGDTQLVEFHGFPKTWRQLEEIVYVGGGLNSEFN